ncbi:hypothetical protein CSB86_6556 [Pseudomonas aeruginosa]|nr:hypothetical protein CSB86_6556 [Pseudomonas aeruginosa]
MVGIETLPTVFFQASSLRIFLICSFIAELWKSRPGVGTPGLRGSS